MKLLTAVFITVVLWYGCVSASAFLSFDLLWILVAVTSLWAGIDASRIELYRYRLLISCKPVILFCCCYLFWIPVFPWYLWARFMISAGEADMQSESPADIGPVRHFFRGLSRSAGVIANFISIGAVVFKIIFSIVLIEEGWRGPREWESFKSQLEAKGQSFDWEAMIPPNVPDAQNFFSAPKMSAWFVRPSGKITVTSDWTNRLIYTAPIPAVMIGEVSVGQHADPTRSREVFHFDDFKSHQQARRLIQNIAGPGAFDAKSECLVAAQIPNASQVKPLRIFLESDGPINIKDLHAFFGGDIAGSPLTFKSSGSNAWHVLSSFCGATDYLKWSDQFEDDFALMREAVKRPYARIDGDYSFPAYMPIPNYINIRAVSQTLAQRAKCHLLLSQPEKALEELTLINDLRRITEGAPTGKPMPLVSIMINAAVVGLYVDTIADGFRLKAWQEPQIISLQKQLAQIELLPFLKESFRDEEVSAWEVWKNSMARYDFEHISHPRPTRARKVKPPEAFLLRGFFYFNILHVVKREEIIYASVDVSRRVVLPKKTVDFVKSIDRPGPVKIWNTPPYDWLTMIVVPNYTAAVRSCALQQAKADEAQIVCALERYHTAHGGYPETLNELTPQFIAKLPTDVVGGQALKYQRAQGDQFLLYSIGWDEMDGGGKFSSSIERGDWGWQ